MNELVDTTEMYLRTIYDLEEEGVTPLRARIAERLEQSGSTVSQTVSRMERDGLLRVAGDAPSGAHRQGPGAGDRSDAQAPPRRTTACRRHRIALGRSARRGMPVGARDERGCRAPAGSGARQPHHIPVRQPDPGLLDLGVGPEFDGGDANLVRLTELPAGSPVAVVVRQLTEHVQGDIDLITRLKDAGVVPNARVTVETHTERRSDHCDPGP